MRAQQITQFSPLVASMDESLDTLHDVLGTFPSRRNRLDETGVDLAITPFPNETFLELIAPFDADSAAHRLVTTRGPGWFMLNVDVDDADTVEDIDAEIRESGVRVVAGGVDAEHRAGSWHIHPRDAGGVLLALYVRRDRPDHTDWAGPTWRHFTETNGRVIRGLAGASIATLDLRETEATYRRLGFTFDAEHPSEEEHVLEARLPGGTFLQLRQPLTGCGPLREWLDRQGPGLYHLAIEVSAPDLLLERLERRGAPRIRELDTEDSRWVMGIPGGVAMPLELRSPGINQD